MRPVNKDNPRNIKCEHCKFFERAELDDWKSPDWCCLHQVTKNYWNRCKQFEWRDKYMR